FRHAARARLQGGDEPGLRPLPRATRARSSERGGARRDAERSTAARARRRFRAGACADQAHAPRARAALPSGFPDARARRARLWGDRDAARRQQTNRRARDGAGSRSLPTPTTRKRRMNEERDDYMSAQRTAGEWYGALAGRPPHGADGAARKTDACFAEWLTRSSAHEAELERCEAAVTLAQALADDPDLAFAYAEARALASRPRPAALRALHGHSSASAVGASRRLWPAFAG